MDFTDDVLLGDMAGEGVEVTTPSGDVIRVLNYAERDYYNSLVERYTADLRFTNIADLQSLTLVIALETACHRWTQWLLAEKDYQGNPIIAEKTRKEVKDTSVEIRQLKEALGIDRKTREKDHGETIADQILNLGRRAKRFGIMRNEQAIAAITLWKALVGEVNFYQQATEEERIEFHKNPIDIVNWVIARIPEFDNIDAKFRATDQRFWILNPMQPAFEGEAELDKAAVAKEKTLKL